MAVAFQGFSIREYTAKMRSVDVMKCYPFTSSADDGGDDEKKRDDVAALLPPMTVTKFKWWSHELHRLKTTPSNHHHQEILTLLNEQSSDIPRNDIQVSAVRLHGHEEEEVEEEEEEEEEEGSVAGHIDSCLAHSKRQRREMIKKPNKFKQPKKRSIAEIFAVAPQIQTHHQEEAFSDEKQEDVDDDEDEDEDEDGKEAKRIKKKKKMMKKKKMKMMNDGSIANKESKLKLQNPVSFAKKLNKRLAVLDIWDAVTVRARTPSRKYLSAKKRKVVQSSKHIPKHQKPRFALRSILKNHDVCGQNSTFCSMADDSLSNPCGIQHSERHVRFSGKDHVLGPRNNGVSSSEHDTIGNLFSDSFASSSEKDQSADSNKEEAPVEVDTRENDASTSTDNGTEACSIVPDHVDIPSFLRPHVTHKEIVMQPEKPVPVSRVATEENNLSMFEPPYAAIPRLISTLEEQRVNRQGVTASSDFGSVMSSRAYTGSVPEPSSSQFTLNKNAKERMFSDHGLHCQNPPMDLTGASYPFPEWKQRAVTCRERYADRDFFGLPLNSHGELIQLSPRGKSGCNQTRKLNTAPGSSSSLPVQNFTPVTNMSSLSRQNFSHIASMRDYLTAHNKSFTEREVPHDQLNLFPMQNYVKENPPCSHLADRFGVTYLENTQRADIHRHDFESSSSHSHSFCPRDSDGNLMNMSTSGNRQLEQVQNQQTMRLMGKDVPIGKSSKDIHRCEDGKVWTDKEIITEHSSSLDKNFRQSWFQVPHTANSKEIVELPSDPLQKLLMKAPEVRFSHPYHAWQSNPMFQNGIIAPDRSPSSNLIHFAQLPSPPTMFNGAPNFQHQFMSGAESLQSLQFGSQLPVFSAPQNTCGHGILSQPHFARSAFDFPFLNPDVRENVHSQWFQSSSKGLPPWLLHATAQGKPLHNVGSNYHHQIMAGTRTFLDAPPTYYSSESSYPCNLVTTSHSQAKNSTNPPSAMSIGNNRSRIRIKERMKSKAFGVKDPYPCKKTKRLAGKATDSTKPPHIFNFEMQENFNNVAGPGPSRGNFFSEMQSNLRAVQLDTQEDDRFRTSGIESPKVRSGPIKLCAGAKHIIKPTQNVEQDNSRPIHSTIPFVAVTHGFREPDPQKKTTKIYRF